MTSGTLSERRTRSRRAVTCASRRLPKMCAMNTDCSVVKCNLIFARKKGTVTFKVNKCNHPATMTTRIQVPSLRMKWSHTFRSNKPQPPILIPSFSYDMGVMQGGVFLRARLRRKTGNRLVAKVCILYTVKQLQKSRVRKAGYCCTHLTEHKHKVHE